MSIWIHHKELDRYSEIEEESLPVWEDSGWVQTENPVVEDTERFSAVELVARREQLAVEFPGQFVAPSSDQVIEDSTGTPVPDASTEPASLNQDSGTPQED